VTWDHIPGYLSDTSFSDSHSSMLDLVTVSESSGLSASSMPGLHTVSNSTGSVTSDSDWLSEVVDVAQGDDLGLQLSDSDLMSAWADILAGEMDNVAAILSEVV
jgi:hypothetical protein